MCLDSSSPSSAPNERWNSFSTRHVPSPGRGAEPPSSLRGMVSCRVLQLSNTDVHKPSTRPPIACILSFVTSFPYRPLGVRSTLLVASASSLHLTVPFAFHTPCSIEIPPLLPTDIFSQDLDTSPSSSRSGAVRSLPLSCSHEISSHVTERISDHVQIE